jgi:hypothetical protein
MTINKLYRVTKRIKIHTSPLIEVEVVNEGVFKKETKEMYVFDTFRVRKSCLVMCEEIRGDDDESENPIYPT